MNINLRREEALHRQSRNLKRIRADLGLTQREIAERLQITVTTSTLGTWQNDVAFTPHRKNHIYIACYAKRFVWHKRLDKKFVSIKIPRRIVSVLRDRKQCRCARALRFCLRRSCRLGGAPISIRTK